MLAHAFLVSFFVHDNSNKKKKQPNVLSTKCTCNWRFILQTRLLMNFVWKFYSNLIDFDTLPFGLWYHMNRNNNGRVFLFHQKVIICWVKMSVVDSLSNPLDCWGWIFLEVFKLIFYVRVWDFVDRIMSLTLSYAKFFFLYFSQKFFLSVV